MSAVPGREEATVTTKEARAVGPERGEGAAGPEAPVGDAVAARTVVREAPIDPRAVRVTLAPTSRLDSDPTLTVGPPPVPIEPLRDQLAGVGILGGTVPGGAAATPTKAAAPVTARVGDPAGEGSGASNPLVDGAPADVRLEWLDETRAILVRGVGAEATRTPVVLGPARPRDGSFVREIVVDGWRFDVVLESERRAALRERSRRGTEVSGRTGPLEVRAIIPGRIVAISVEAGSEIVPGQVLLVLEAMKMQNELRAPREGTIERVGVAVGVNVEVGDLLMVIS